MPKWLIVCGHLSGNVKTNALSDLSLKRTCDPNECKCTDTSSFPWICHGFSSFCPCLRNVPSWETDDGLCNHPQVHQSHIAWHDASLEEELWLMIFNNQILKIWDLQRRSNYDFPPCLKSCPCKCWGFQYAFWSFPKATTWDSKLPPFLPPQGCASSWELPPTHQKFATMVRWALKGLLNLISEEAELDPSCVRDHVPEGVTSNSWPRKRFKQRGR